MTKQLFLFCLLCLITFSLSAQGKFLGQPIKAISINAGIDQDLLNGMDKDYFISMMSDPSKAENFNFDLASEDKWGGICENPNFGLAVTLQLPRKLEWSLEFNTIFNRVDALTYRSNNWDGYGSEYINFSTFSDEINVGTSVLKRIGLSPFTNRLGNKRINLYLGAGTNIGAIYNHDMSVWGSEKVTVDAYSYDGRDDLRSDVTENVEYEYYGEYVDMNAGFTQRIYGEAGLGFTLFRRVELGARYKYGYGYRATKGHGAMGTNLRSLSFNLRWLLQ